MLALKKAIYGKLSGSALDAHIAGRLFDIEAPEGGAEYPYGVYFIVYNSPEYPGEKTIEQFMIQFSLFSATPGDSTEAEGMLADLWTLYDDVIFTITGYKPIYFIRGNLIEMMEDHTTLTTPSGTRSVYHYSQEYDGWIVKD